MRVVAYYAIHYGSEWLFWSMRSIKDFVDEIVVVYSENPSHGHGTDAKCPDSRETLKLLANRFDARWVEIRGSHWEGIHRDQAVRVCQDEMGADIILVVDHDEIWEPDHLKKSIKWASTGAARNYLVPFQHYWRSVGWVCHDEAMPVRLHKVGGEGNEYIPRQYGKVHHFGYAQSSKLIEYKWKIHGHLSELRPDWYEGTFLPWTPGMGDVHPTNVNFWTPEEFDRQKLEDLIEDHPFYGMDIIP